MNTVRSVGYGWGVLIVGSYSSSFLHRPPSLPPPPSPNTNTPRAPSSPLPNPQLTPHPPTAGGGAYYFAKRSINADRQARLLAEQERYRRQEALRQAEYLRASSSSSSSSPPKLSSSIPPPSSSAAATKQGKGISPSEEASEDPAPTRHAPTTEGERVQEKSKWEASEVWVSKKGDRLR
ncbi:hypothetical protein K402DRAFT_457816 [Aulographum hederae CBS 113979]|uniref:Uncharacterized protein n=1 Tax=Aulographum hederae CBS 113979 TaxID=1176131 RepID=A0A6G1GLJ9_9PEZI|nr:hypothetical protein K402DRAFT_457816 [Aulographum hederae CBS 113979]